MLGSGNESGEESRDEDIETDRFGNTIFKQKKLPESGDEECGNEDVETDRYGNTIDKQSKSSDT